MRKQLCQYGACRNVAVGVWTNWGQGIEVPTCDRHRYPVRSGPTKCWRWVRKPTVKYGVWKRHHD